MKVGISGCFMFIGEYHHTLDEKGRMALPVKFRSALAGGCVVTRGIDQCLSVYTTEEWKLLATKLAALPVSQANSRAFARLMLSGAMDTMPDAQGRIVIPEYLRAYAKCAKEVVVVGLYTRLEVWSRDAWDAYKRDTESASPDIAEKLSELGV